MDDPSNAASETQSPGTQGWRKGKTAFPAQQSADHSDRDLAEMPYRTLIEQGLGLICTHDLQGNLLSINNAAAHALGFEPNQLIGRNGRDLLPASVRHLFESYLIRIRRDGRDEGLMRLASRGGREMTWLYRNVLHTDAAARQYVLGYAQDVTKLHQAHSEARNAHEQLKLRVEQRAHQLRVANDRLRSEATEHKQTAEALKASELRHRALLEAVPDMIFRMRRDGTFLDFKPARGVPPHRPPSEFIGSTLREMLPKEVARPCMAAMRRACETGRAEVVEYKLPVGGEERDFEARLLTSGTEEVLGVVRDVTDRKRNEAERQSSSERKQHQERLEALGALAGGIAHDFNNLLMSVLGYTELARIELPDDHPAATQIDEAIDAATRASELTMQMLTFAGSGTSSSEMLELNAIVHEADQRIRQLFPPVAEVIYHTAPALPPFRGNALHVRQVILNLVTNAVEALGADGGTDTITTRIGPVPTNVAPELSPPTDTHGDHVCLSVTDTGCGMDDEIRAKIFDPFFTTKFTGRGLGLATVLGVVRAHGGMLNVTSAPGAGTTIEVWFPVAAETPGDTTASREPDESESMTGIVLVVDDDASVRDVARQMLTRAGFEVLTAANGREGLHAFETHHMVTAVLLDLTMPVMDGKEALRLFKRLAPDLPVVLMSGYDERDTARVTGDAHRITFLQKPFTRRALVTAIAHVLTSDHEAA